MTTAGRSRLRDLGFAVALAAVLMLLATTAGLARAQDYPGQVAVDAAGDVPPAGATDASEVARSADIMANILVGPDFRRIESKESYTFWDDVPAEDDPIRLPGWLKALFDGVAGLVRAGLWLLVFALVVLTLIYFRKPLAALLDDPRTRSASSLPQRVAGMDVRPETLPDDIPGAARAAWADGRPRQALSLLYRGVLSVLVNRDGLQFFDGDTEQECVRRVAAASKPLLIEYFGLLTRTWLYAAYGDRYPGPTAFESLCDRFEAALADEAPT